MRISTGIQDFGRSVGGWSRVAFDEGPVAGARFSGLDLTDGLEPVSLEPRAAASAGARARSVEMAEVGGAAAVLPQAGPNQRTVFEGGVDTMPYARQTGNGCGTTSLGMILTHLTGRHHDQATVDAAIRRTDIFTSPGDVVAYSRRQGLNSEGYNHGSPERLQAFLDRGVPVQVVLNNSGNRTNLGALHYVAVVGYELDEEGNLAGFLVHDPHGKKDPDSTKLDFVSLGEFDRKWAAAKPGFDRFFIAHAQRGVELPTGDWDGMLGTVAVSESVTNVVNNVDRILDPDSVGDFVHGVVSLPGTLLHGLRAGTAGLASLGLDWVESQVEKVPVVRNVFGPAVALAGGVVDGVSSFFGGIGNGADHLGGAVGNLLDGNWNDAWQETKAAADSVWQGAKDAVIEPAKGLWNAAKKLWPW